MKLSIRRFNRKKKCWALAPTILTVLLVLAPLTLFAQSGEFFNVRSIVRDVKSQFKLDRRDLSRISPLIENENFDVLMIYVRFGGNEPEYSRAVWRDVMSRRTDFEARLDRKLTLRQQSALRAARAALERRVLEFLIDDYLYFVSDLLELDGLELEAVEHLFDKEIRRKHNLLLKNLRRSAFLQREFEKVSDETEGWLIKILTPEQLRIYRSLSVTGDNLIGG